jgi:hypothetical protein
MAGAPSRSGGGAVYVVFGSAHPVDVNTTALSATAHTNGTNPAPHSPIGSRYDGFLQDDHMGMSPAVVPDVNGDGYDDVAVGAPDANLHRPGGGGVAVLYGKPQASTSPSVRRRPTRAAGSTPVRSGSSAATCRRSTRAAAATTWTPRAPGSGSGTSPPRRATASTAPSRARGSDPPWPPLATRTRMVARISPSAPPRRRPAGARAPVRSSSWPGRRARRGAIRRRRCSTSRGKPPVRGWEPRSQR